MTKRLSLRGQSARSSTETPFETIERVARRADVLAYDGPDGNFASRDCRADYPQVSGIADEGFVFYGGPVSCDVTNPTLTGNSAAGIFVLNGGDGVDGHARHRHRGLRRHRLRDQFHDLRLGAALHREQPERLAEHEPHGHGDTQGAEIDVTNVSSTTPTINPCSMGGTGTTPAPWLGSGRADVAFGNAATAAIGIIDNGANLAPGGGVGSSAPRVTNGQADALVTACQLALKWREPTTATTLTQIRSDRGNASAASISSLSVGGSVTFHDPATSTTVGTISDATTKAGGGTVSA